MSDLVAVLLLLVGLVLIGVAVPDGVDVGWTWYVGGGVVGAAVGVAGMRR